MLFLRSTEKAESLWPELHGALALQFRLIAPDVPADAEDVTAWLTDFLEGIGMPSMGVLATDDLCLPAFELAARDPEQVARLVLVCDGTRESALQNAVASAPARASLEVIVVRRDQPADDAVLQVTSFLAGE